MSVKHYPQKKKCVRGNTKSHVTKNLRSAIMKRFKLKSCDDIINYKNQRIFKLIKISKFEYFNEYDLNKQRKLFWVNAEPYFLSNKHSKADTNIMLSKNGELIMKNQDIANTFSNYFGSIVENLDLFQWNHHNGDINSKKC